MLATKKHKISAHLLYRLEGKTVSENIWLPIVFISLMGLAVLLYAILDGYDLGVGMLLPRNTEEERDQMIASIGPFWDANETWLVLAVGLLLIAFPAAHNIVLRELYLPATVMLGGLILRGVAFDFRAKVGTAYRKKLWDKIFTFGSLTTSFSQGYMLGFYVVGFNYTAINLIFALVSALCVTAAYIYIGGSWLIMKAENNLQEKAVLWTRRSGWLTALGVVLVSVINLWNSPQIIDKWLSNIYGLLLLLVPLACAMLFFVNDRILREMKNTDMHRQKFCWLPFANTTLIFIFCFVGLAFSFYPYVIPESLTIWESASAAESLSFLFWGAIFVIPAILAYTAFSYRVFWGKAKPLDYY